MTLSDAGPIGDLVDALGVEASIGDGDLATAAVVLIKIVDADGHVALQAAWSDGMSWIERLGMLTAALHEERTASSTDEV